MVTPTPYVRVRDYSQYQADNPDAAFSGADFDADFDGVKVTTDSLATCLATIREDDGSIKHQGVGIDQLDPAIVMMLNGINPRGDWVTATRYLKGDLILNGALEYVCLVNHTSGDFATDLAAGDWMQMSQKGAKGDTGATGATGPQGPQGPAGADGANGTNGTNGADGATGPQGPAGWGGVRQTVSAGPVTTAGLPNFLPATATGLSVTTQNVDSTHPLVAAAANGWDGSTGLPVDTIGYTTANLTWGSLTNNTTNYLYGTISGGVITPASTTLAPVYQRGGTPATTNGQITFNIAEMKAYLGNGTTAPQTNLVVFGEAVTSGGNVTSPGTFAYAYNGQYDSGYTATLPSSTNVNVNHNLGVPADGYTWDLVITCTTTNAGYAVGQSLRTPSLRTNDGSAVMNIAAALGTNTLNWRANATIDVANISTGVVTSLTAGSWKYKFVVNRSW